MKITCYKHCFGYRFEVKGKDIEPTCDGFFFEEILSEVGNGISFDEDECDQCFDYNYTTIYEIDEEKWKSIRFLFT